MNGEGATPLQEVRASVKLAAALALVSGLVAVPAARIVWSLAVVPVIVVVAFVARLPATRLLGRIALVLPFVVATSLLALLQKNGLVAFGTIVLRVTLCVAVVQLLTMTTPFPEIVSVLRRAHVPVVLVTTLSLLHRYVFVLLDEAGRMRRARAARTLRVGRIVTWRIESGVVGQLFVRSTQRAERIEAAMRARGAT